jgi:hypothetical protein
VKKKLKLTEEQRADVMREMGARGGANSRKNLMPEERKRLAQKAVQARWARWRQDNGKPPEPGDDVLLGGSSAK